MMRYHNTNVHKRDSRKTDLAITVFSRRRRRTGLSWLQIGSKHKRNKVFNPDQQEADEEQGRKDDI